MMDKEHLHLLIDEEIYLINEVRHDVSVTQESDQKDTREVEEVEEVMESHSPTIHIDQEELDHPHKEETPKIPEVHHHSTASEENKSQPIPLAIFHEASNEAEIALLQKIIDACNLKTEDYQVFANGFNKEVRFIKGLIFTGTAKKYYTPVPYQKSQFLCSKPLAEIINDVQEKGKLWIALKSFVKTDG